MNLTPHSITDAATLGAWTLVRPSPSPTSGVLAFAARHEDGRPGLLRVMDRSALGPDGGASLVEMLERLDRVGDARVQKLLALGFATYESRDVLYLVTAPVDGASLAELVGGEPGALLPKEVCAIVRQAAEALGAAHAAGVTHGNITPACIYLLAGRRLLLTDFGLAPSTKGTSGALRQYPAPELRDGAAASASGDVFSLALCGAAFACGTGALLDWQKCEPGTEAADVMASLEKGGGLAPEVTRALVGALHPDPVARPAPATLASALAPAAGDLPEIAPAESSVQAPGADGSQAKIDAWLGGEITDPQRRIPTRPADPPAAPLPSTVPAANVLPGPPLAFLVEKGMDAGPAEEVYTPPAAEITGSSIVSSAPLTSEITPTARRPVSNGTPPPPESVLPKAGPVVVNMVRPRVLPGAPGDHPLIARWTDRTGGKGQTPVEIVRPSRSAAPSGPQRTPVMALGAGFVIGVAVGLVLRAFLAGPVGPPTGALRVEAAPAEADLDVDVFVDGKAMGRPPVDVAPLVAGPHVVVLQAEGAEPKVISVNIEPGATSVVKDAPELFAARLVVTASVKTGTVALDDEPPRPLPAEFDDLDPGEEVEISLRSGGTVTRRKVRLPAGELHYHFDVSRAASATDETRQTTPPDDAPAVEEPKPAPEPAPAPDDRTPSKGHSPGKSAGGSHASDKDAARDHEAAGRRALIAGRFEDAATELEKALRLDPTLAEPAKSLGIVMTRLGRTCDGLKYYRRYLVMRPKASDVERVQSIIRDLEDKAPDCK